MRWFWPQSLAGQMVLLIAIALFVAQAINFAMLLHERGHARLEQIAGPVAARVLDAVERTTQGRGPVADRGRIRRLPANPVTAQEKSQADVDERLRAVLIEGGFRPGVIASAVRPADPRDAPPWQQRIERRTHIRSELVIAVEQPGMGWLVQRVPWPGNDWFLLWRLIGQTLILYVIVLLPVIWIGRRISRPLRDLTMAADRFAPGEEGPLLTQRGPHDIAHLIAAFNALTLRVTAMLDEKNRMLGAIGHDLRTPLAALRVRIESVEDETDRTRMAETIAEMNGTLDDILSLARIGRPSEAPTEVDLAALVDAVVEDFRDLGCDVQFADTDRLRTRLRPSLMRRAVRNLIENAVKYGQRADVRIETSSTDIRIVVADEGPGIPPDRLADVFDPFTRLEQSRNRETGGIGLGLALARSIVQDAGGGIVLTNREGGGLDATIILPR
ncbi:HAMP domain-containing sensor histidine kinase [Sphingomonas bacterium]|uniref:sensor histidine kinase n=1 Tax=Sphingomonas bacterium TaxID=1895847 RepID=UPI0020C660B4|nr:HAMP domain-containing sensor histidine kinase [Sphingomonas bacterium]